MSNIARYTAGHLFQIDGARTPLVEQIATTLGGLNETDFEDLDRFVQRTNQLCEVASEHDCKLYVDAEQTFIQAAIESFG